MNAKKLQKQNEQRFIYPDEALHNFFIKGLIWNDRATRSEYWWTRLLLGVISVFSSIIPILGLLFGLLVFIPSLALTARRWNDLGYNGIKLTIFELLLIPGGVIISILLIALFALTGGNPVDGFSILFTLYLIVIPIFYIVKTIFFCMPSKVRYNQYVYAQKRPSKKQHARTYRYDAKDD